MCLCILKQFEEFGIFEVDIADFCLASVCQSIPLLKTGAVELGENLQMLVMKKPILQVVLVYIQLS